MGRTALKPTLNTNNDIPEDVAEKKGQAAQELAALQAGYGQGRDLLNQMIGHAQSRMAMRDFANVMSLSVLKHVKENKLYRGAEGQKAYDKDGAEIPNVGTWEGFCRAVGVSVAKADEDIANINTFGEDALASLQMVGVGYRDLRQFRKLPADQKTALIEAAKVGDKDTLLELAEDLIAKHTKEKEDLQKNLAEAEKAVDTHKRVAEEANAEATAIKAQSKVVAHTDWPDALVPLTDQVAAAGRKLATALSELETCRITLFATEAELQGDDQARFAAAMGHVADVYQEALERAERTIAKERLDFDRTLGNMTSGGAQ